MLKLALYILKLKALNLKKTFYVYLMHPSTSNSTYFYNISLIKLIYFLKEIFSLITSVSCSLYNYTTVTFSYYIVGETGSFISVERCSITDLLFHWYWLWWYDRILKL